MRRLSLKGSATDGPRRTEPTHVVLVRRDGTSVEVTVTEMLDFRCKQVADLHHAINEIVAHSRGATGELAQAIAAAARLLGGAK